MINYIGGKVVSVVYNFTKFYTWSSLDIQYILDKAYIDKDGYRTKKVTIRTLMAKKQFKK